MSGSTLLAWTLVAVLGVMTPGIDTLLVLRHTMLGGRRAGLATVAGITLGYLVWASASLAGLTALLAASQTAYDAVRIAGAGYLVWLGGSALWRSWRAAPPGTAPDAGTAAAGTTPARRTAALRAGMVTNLLNPKVGVFYISILPQFLPTAGGTAGWGAVLVAVHVAVTFVWYPTLVWAAARAGPLLLRHRVRRWLDRVSAAVLLGIGLKLAADTT